MRITRKVCAVAASLMMLCTAAPLLPVTAVVDGVEMTAVITLNGDTITATGENVTVDGSNATITASGSYEISGTLNAGQIRVAVPDEVADPETVKLYLNGVSITGETDAAIYVINAEKTSLNLVAGTENFLYDGATYTETSAVIYAKDDITIKGDGALTITAATQHGVHCKNDLKINSGNIRVDTDTADALRGKTSVEINGGFLNINSEGDGIKSTQGDVFITGGVHEVKAGNDAVQGETSLVISGGELLANGDRSLTCATAAVTISGGKVLATATDNQPAAVNADQPVMMLNFTEEQVKDQTIHVYDTSVLDADFELLSMKPDKKFSYMLISTPEMTADGIYAITMDDVYLTYGTTATDINFTMNGLLATFDAVALSDMVFPPTTIVGDVNCDGYLKVDDVILMSRFISEDHTLEIPEVGYTRMDINNDGITDIADVTALLRIIAGITT